MFNYLVMAQTKCENEYELFRDFIVSQLMMKEGLSDGESKITREEKEEFCDKSDKIIFANDIATLVKIGEKDSLVICPNHITYLDESTGAKYKVAGEPMKILYNIQSFRDDMNNAINNNDTKSLIDKIMLYSIMSKQINEVIKECKSHGDNEQKIFDYFNKNIKVDDHHKREAIKQLYFNTLETKTKNNAMAINKLMHAKKRFQGMGVR